MKHITLITIAIAAVALMFAPTVEAAEPPADRVVALYFHRTERCPTCRKMGSYTEEAIKKGYTSQIKKGSVEFHFVDFQNKKNAALTKGYKVKGPVLIIAKIRGNKVKEYANLDEMWTKVRDKPEFIRYVRKNVDGYLR
jgi:hypothetical protein